MVKANQNIICDIQFLQIQYIQNDNWRGQFQNMNKENNDDFRNANLIEKSRVLPQLSADKYTVSLQYFFTVVTCTLCLHMLHALSVNTTTVYIW